MLGIDFIINNLAEDLIFSGVFRFALYVLRITNN
ncbi:hypothetical protein IMSAGC021_00137 [Muribaculaceae bacterium]|nr:hypothetical protein IMSAGC021_00137 [Muribaculaceae bacterium]